MRRFLTWHAAAVVAAVSLAAAQPTKTGQSPDQDLPSHITRLTLFGDRPTVEEQEAMARDLGADSLFYLPLEAVARCINLPEDPLCRACLTGKYPTPTGEKLYQLAWKNRNGSANGRTYEMAAVSSS